MGPFDGRVALVTGAGSGIGRAAAVAFARGGAKVVAAGRREEEGGETVRLVEEAGGDGLFVRTDVGRAADVEALVRRAVGAFGRLDYAFNNAGTEEPASPLHEQTEEQFDRIMTTNVKGVWLGMKYEVAQMLRTGGGVIVNVSSIHGVTGADRNSIYSAGSHAVIGLTKSAALEYAKRGIRVNAVCPAAIDTDMMVRVGGGRVEKLKEEWAGQHPVGRLGTPDDVAGAVVWLCSGAASFVTGHALMVDGGYTAQ